MLLPAVRSSDSRRAVVALSWYGASKAGGTTLGDQYAIENLSHGLSAAGIEHFVVSDFPLDVGGRDIRFRNAPLAADVAVHVCGPLMPGDFVGAFFARSRKRVAVGVSLLPQFANFYKLFDAIVIRDGQAPETFDLSLSRFANTPTPSRVPSGAPRIGLCLRGVQREYGRQRRVFSDKALQLFTAAIERIGGVVHRIDTVLRDDNTAEQIEEGFRRADIIATTRMHGAILGLAFGKPVVAIDQIEGSAKLANVVGRTGWPLIFRGESVTQDQVDAAFAQAMLPAIDAVVDRARGTAIRLSSEAVAISVRTIAGLAAARGGPAVRPSGRSPASASG